MDILFHCLLVLAVDEKFAVCLIATPLEILGFFLCSFKIFLFEFNVYSFITMSQVNTYFYLYCSGPGVLLHCEVSFITSFSESIQL